MEGASLTVGTPSGETIQVNNVGGEGVGNGAAELTDWRLIGDVELRGLDALTEEVRIVNGLENDPPASGLNGCVPTAETKDGCRRRPAEWGSLPRPLTGPARGCRWEPSSLSVGM